MRKHVCVGARALSVCVHSLTQTHTHTYTHTHTHTHTHMLTDHDA